MPRRGPPEPDTVTPVPQGGGIDGSVDPFLLAPPKSGHVVNMRVDKGGAYRKRPGWSTITTTPEENALLVPGKSEALLMGGVPPLLVNSFGTSPVGFGCPSPTTLEHRRIRAGSGFVHSVQCASNGTYTAVAITHAEDVTLGFARPETSTATEMMILDDQYRVVWGPYIRTDIKYLPRIEPVSDTAFAFFGVDLDDLATAGSSYIVGDPELVFTLGTVGGGAPATPTVLATLWPGDDATNKVFKLYDTDSDGDIYGDGATCCYVAFQAYDVSGRRLRVYRITSAGVTHSSNTASPPDECGHIAIAHDADSGAVLVLDHAAGETLSYDASDLTIAGSGVALPSLAGIDVATVLGDTGPHTATPVFFRDIDGDLHLNEHSVTITGSGSAATPAYGAVRDELLPILYEPFELSQGLQFTFSGAAATADNNALAPGGNTVEVYHQATNADGDLRPVMDVPIAESRWGDNLHRLYTWWTFNASTGSRRESPCVTGQVVRTWEDSALIPVAYLTSNQHARAAADDAVLTEVVGPYSRFGHTAGAGYFNDEQVVSLCEVRASSERHSHVRVEDTTLVAVGGLAAWSAGGVVGPSAVRGCRIVDVEIDSLSSNPTPERTYVGVSDFTDATNAPTYESHFYYKVVLVFTDANGLEYRSAPSNKFLQQGVLVEDEWDDYCPAVVIEMHPQVWALRESGRTIDVEIYVTQRNGESAITDEVDIDETSYTMVNRFPLQQGGGGDYYAVDTMQDFAGVNVGVLPDVTYAPGWENPPHVTPLYSLVEAENAHPPAMHVIAQAGQYLFGVSSEDPYELWVSKPLTKGRAPEWSALLTVYAPATCGGIVALAATYDRVYLLCKKGVWELPAHTGFDSTAAGSFPKPRLVFDGVSCTGQAGVVQTPAGTFYVTLAGPRLLSGNGEDVYIGEPVADVFDGANLLHNPVPSWDNVRASFYDPIKNEVCWLCSWPRVAGFGGGDVVIDPEEGDVGDVPDIHAVYYNLTSNAWTTSTIGANSACITDDHQSIRLDADGTLTYETEAAYGTGVSDEYNLGLIWTPWLHLGDPHSWKRYLTLSLLGRINGSGTGGQLSIHVQHDYDETTTQTATWALSDLATLTKQLQLRVKLGRQKAAAIRIAVSEWPTQTGVGQGQEPIYASQMDWTLVSLDLRLRGKVGVSKLEQQATK